MLRHGARALRDDRMARLGKAGGGALNLRVWQHVVPVRLWRQMLIGSELYRHLRAVARRVCAEYWTAGR